MTISGEERWLSGRRRPLEGGGEVYILEDITRLHEMEAQVKRDERLAAVGRFAASLAHEIRNPLASLSGAVQLLEEREANPLHRIVLREVQRLNSLVEDFLESARPLELKRTSVDLVELLEEVAEAFRHDPRCQGLREVKLSLSPMPQLQADPARLRQVLWNLLVNAAQATEDGGQIDIHGGPSLDGVRLVVADDGAGIPAEKKLRIFDPFYTTRAGGTGLGLAIVDWIVRAHGGEIRVESTLGVGTAFIITLQSSKHEEAGDVR
ncbi:MAG: signal transduction histidine kinase [Myxococcota bacterium]